MRIALVGGSNTILTNGWWRGFRDGLPGATLANFGIGGTTSLTGIHQLVTERIFERFDGVAFEYTLNDALQKPHYASAERVQSTIAAVLALHRPHRHRVRLRFLLGAPRTTLRAVLAGECYVHRTYREMLSAANIPFVDATEVVARAYDDPERAYANPPHYTVEAQEMLGREMARIWDEPAEPGEPPPGILGYEAMRVIPIEALRFRGEVETVERATTLRRMTMRRFRHGAEAHLDADGILLGAFGCVTADAGQLLISGNCRSVTRQTLNRLWSERHPTLFHMHQLLAPMPFSRPTGGLTLRVGGEAGVPEDRSPHGYLPMVPPAQQAVELSHLLVLPPAPPRAR
jgi:hypothetical protein